jgi:hypothetical protein
MAAWSRVVGVAGLAEVCRTQCALPAVPQFGRLRAAGIVGKEAPAYLDHMKLVEVDCDARLAATNLFEAHNPLPMGHALQIVHPTPRECDDRI